MPSPLSPIAPPTAHCRQRMAEEAERARGLTALLQAEREALAKMARERETAKDQVGWEVQVLT